MSAPAPNFPKAEQAVLGAMLIEREAIVVARQWLQAGDFYVGHHRTIFGAISEVFNRNESADLITVGVELQKAGKFGEVGGEVYLAECMSACSTAANVESYAFIVRGASLERAIQEQLRLTYKEPTSENVSKIGELIRKREGLKAYGVIDFQRDMLSLIEGIQKKKIEPGWKSGFDGLDRFMTTAKPGKLMVVGARTSVGKTVFLTKLAVKLAQQGVPTLYITTEMTPQELVFRIFPSTCNIPASRFETGLLKEEDWSNLTQGAVKLADLPLKIIGKPRVSIEDLRAAVYQTGAKAVIFDYLQRAKLGKAERHDLAVGYFVEDFKTFLQETGVFGATASQLSRDLDKEPNRPPCKADLVNSAGIEHNADIIVLLWPPPEKKLKGVQPQKGGIAIEGILDKQRNGPAPRLFQMELVGRFVDMKDRAEFEEPPAQAVLI